MIRSFNCLLAAAWMALAFSAPAGEVTYSKDVAPILAKHCARCHRPGEVAPMSLLSYDEARPWAKSIKKAIAEQAMPPWHADPHFGKWANDMSLTEAERTALIAWVDQGSPRGAEAAEPATAKLSNGWELGEPDYIVKLPKIDLPAKGDDIFPSYVVELALEKDEWIRAVEFRPGDRRVVHHILTMLGDAQMGSSKYDVRMTTRKGGGAAELFGVWVAGAQPTVYPDGMGRILSQNQIMTFNMHYHLRGEATSDETQIGLHFGKGPLQKRISTNFGVNLGLKIPPGEANYTQTAYHQFDQDSQIISFMPHMHVRGKAVKYTARYPDGRQEVLLSVPRYDYNWQWIYRPEKFIDVPAGTRIYVEATYDNSTSNPGNPDPTKTVYYRDQTFAEMFVGFMESVPVEGAQPRPVSPAKKLVTLLADHPPEDSYINNGLMGLPWGVYLPKKGTEGKYYISMGSVMFTSNIWNVKWEGDAFKFDSTMVTPGGGGMSMHVEGTQNADGTLKGNLYFGQMEHEANPEVKVMQLGFTGRRPDSNG